MKTAVIVLTRRGIPLARAIQARLGSVGYTLEKLATTEQGFQPIWGSVREFTGWAFQGYEGLIFVSAVGIAVRAIAPHLKDKWSDPAVVVVDERGKFAVSLLSGHWGGGNRLAQEVAHILGATPVITTASDLSGIKTPDMVAWECNFVVEARENLPKVTTLLLEGEQVAYVTDDELVWKLLHGKVQLFPQVPQEAKGVVFITDTAVETPSLPFVILRPRNLVLGVGLRKGVSGVTLQALVSDFFRAQGVALSGLGELASVERKKDDPALRALATMLSVPLRFFTVEELEQVAHLFPASPRVQKVLGVGSVARPSAFLASGGGKELGYFEGRGVTLALFRRVGTHVG